MSKATSDPARGRQFFVQRIPFWRLVANDPLAGCAWRAAACRTTRSAGDDPAILRDRVAPAAFRAIDLAAATALVARGRTCCFRLALAFPVRLVAHKAALACFGNTAVFLDLKAFAANQWTEPFLLLLDRIECAERSDLHLEIHLCTLVKFRHCARRLIGPLAVHRARITADSLEMELQQPGDVGLIHVRQRSRGFRRAWRRRNHRGRLL